MSPKTSMRELADRYGRAVSSADEAALRALFAPGATVWHNHDGIEVSFEASATAFTRWLASFEHYRYTADRLLEAKDAFVLQTTIAGLWKAGPGREAVPFEGHYCLVFSITAGEITRLDEYTDPQTVALGLA